MIVVLPQPIRNTTLHSQNIDTQLAMYVRHPQVVP